MDQARLVRTVRFRARHHYRNPVWSAAENERVFGAQGAPHEHEWRVVAHVTGPVDPATGWCCDLTQVDATLDRVLGGWDGGDLNALIPEVAGGTLRPSTENLARWIFGALRDVLPGPSELVRVEVHESDALGAVYPAGSADFL